ncbi:MAG: methyltransferase family protein [Nitrososphaerales archaeon]
MSSHPMLLESKMTEKKGVEDDNARVVARPPFIYLIPLVVGLLLHLVLPISFLPLALSLVLGIGLFLKGGLIMAWALMTFRRAGTSEKVREPTKMIVTTGPFRYSRNPIYGAFVAIYFGITFLFNTPWPILLLPIVLIVMHYGVITREERYLEGKFGKEYLDYKRKVRRWI